MNIVLTMINTLNMKQMHIDQELKLTECRKSTIDIQCVEPQLRPHRNKIPKRRDLQRSKGLSISSKVRVFRSCQTYHVKQAGTIFHVVDKCLPEHKYIHITT